MKDKNRRVSNIQSYVIDAAETDYLYVQPSQITNAGKGLYTAISIYKDEIIAVFKGDILTASEVRKRVNQKLDSYFINLPDGKIMDSMNNKCFARYANDARGSVKSVNSNNAIITLDEADRPCIIAKRNIKKGEEIFCNYGKSYWKNKNPI